MVQKCISAKYTEAKDACKMMMKLNPEDCDVFDDKKRQRRFRSDPT